MTEVGTGAADRGRRVMKFRTFLCLAIGLAGVANSPLDAASTAWNAPVSGSFFDPARWSAGVPGPGVDVGFGVVAGAEPFVVTLETGVSAKTLTITNQSPRIEIAGSGALGLTLSSSVTVDPTSPMSAPAVFSGGSLKAITLTTDPNSRLELDGVTASFTHVEFNESIVTLRHGATLLVDTLRMDSAGENRLLEVIGPGTTILAEEYVSGDHDDTTTLRVGDGGLVHAPGVGSNSIAFAFGPSGPGRIEATSAFRGVGPLAISIADASTLSPNSWVPLLESPDIYYDFRPVSFQSPFLYPPILRLSADALELMIPDHVDSLAVTLPAFVVPGFRFGCTAIATIDGVEYDVSKTASWESSAARGDFPAPGEWLPSAAGPATITATFGDRVATATAVVPPLLPPHQVIDCGAPISGLPNGPSGDAGSRFGRNVSRDGTRVVFASKATNLVASPALPSGAPQQVYLYDAVIDSRSLISLTSEGAPSPKDANRPVISPDGRFVAFVSSGQLTAVPHAGLGPVPYLRDLDRGTVEALVVTPAGLAATGQVAAISDEGRYVLLSSKEPLVRGDTNGVDDCYRLDRWRGAVDRVSVGAAGEEFPWHATPVDMTPDGASAAFLSTFSVPDSLTLLGHLYVKRVASGELIDVSAPLPQLLELPAPALSGVLSADGRYAAFLAKPQSGGAVVGFQQAFLRDLDTGQLTPISQLPDGTWSDGWVTSVSISDDARFVAFSGAIISLLPTPLPPYPATAACCYGPDQTLLFDRFTNELSVVTQAPNGEYCFPTSSGRWSCLSGDGRTVAYAASDAAIVPFATVDAKRVLMKRSTSWVPGDANRDGVVNGLDIARVIEAWGTADIGADLDLNNTVDAHDLALVLGGFGG